MSPQEMKELPKDEQEDQNDVGILISDDEDVAADEPDPPEEPDPVYVNVEDMDDLFPQEVEEGHAADDEEEEEDDEEEDEEDVDDDDDDDDDDDSSEGRKGEDDDSDDEDEEDDKRPFNDSDDDDDDIDEDDEDSSEDEVAGGYGAAKKAGVAGKRNTFSKGKVMPGASFPLTTGQGYKGDIEDLLRAAAQADEGETSAGNDKLDNIVSLDHGDHAVPEITIKATDDIECEVVNVIEVENDIEEVDADEEEEEEKKICKDLDLEKVPLVKESHTLGDDEDPPQKRMRNS